MWREFILGFTSLCQFSEPATFAEIVEVEQALGVALPDDLRTLLEESNGITVSPVFPELDDLPIELSLVWSTQEMLEENISFRTFRVFDREVLEEFAPIASLLFFASEPNGDPLAFQVANGKVIGPAIIRMRHDNYSECEVVSASLRDYFTAFL